MISLYQALKSEARVVSAFVSALHAVLDHCFATGSLIRAHYHGESCVSRVRKLELLADRLWGQSVLDPEPSISKLMRQSQRVRDIVGSDEREKHVDAPRMYRQPALVFEELAENDVAHAEAYGGELNATNSVQEVIVAPSSTDCAQRAARIE